MSLCFNVEGGSGTKIFRCASLGLVAGAAPGDYAPIIQPMPVDEGNGRVLRHEHS